MKRSRSQIAWCLKHNGFSARRDERGFVYTSPLVSSERATIYGKKEVYRL